VPGGVLELILAHIRQATVLRTYDFIDVVDLDHHIGWQVKSTKRSTPVTWKRAKIPHKDQLIQESLSSEEGRQRLGNAIIEFCNSHVRISVEKYHLRHLVYARLIDFGKGRFVYFERDLPIDRPLFEPELFRWHWSAPKSIITKEQLPALHGVHTVTQTRWFA
jgi:hypothetical protein